MYKALDLWLPAYLRRKPRTESGRTTDIMFAICDHFEPLHATNKQGALDRIGQWQREYPKLIRDFPDADGCRPRHTFFFPVEQYDPDIVSELAELCTLCEGEIELQLHHDRDTAGGLLEKLERGKKDLVRHGFLSRDQSRDVRYGFIHGNWALDNSHPRGRYCGVSTELGVLKQTGCYADFTMPSAPSATQTRIINSIYYAADTPATKSHDTGTLASVAERKSASARNPQLSTLNSQLLLVQGPLGLNWERRKVGVLPRIENAEITGTNPPCADRIKIWLRLGIHVQGQPDWIFIKLHTHGGIPRNMATLLGDPMRHFFEHALKEYNDRKKYRLHFVTAREMVNIIHAAEDGRIGNAGEFRDYRYISPLKQNARSR